MCYNTECSIKFRFLTCEYYNNIFIYILMYCLKYITTRHIYYSFPKLMPKEKQDVIGCDLLISIVTKNNDAIIYLSYFIIAINRIYYNF